MKIAHASQQRLLVAGIVVATLLLYLSPIPLAVRAIALASFFLLAYLQPTTAILCIPATAPLYLIPAAFSGLREQVLLFPLHELLLGLTALAMVSRQILQAVRLRTFSIPRPSFASVAPIALFVIAGIWGTVIALPGSRGEALRELRWLVIEPVIFYLLLKVLPPATTIRAIYTVIIAGTVVALLGMLQLVGLDLVPLIGEKRSFSENIVEAGNVRRVASVYGHPNNLGLFLGRIWPLAAALALGGWLQIARSASAPDPQITNPSPPRIADFNPQPWLAAGLLCLVGLVISFSRGAWLGALAAAAILLLLAVGGRDSRGMIRYLAAAIMLGAVLAVPILVLRGGGGSEGTRLLLWREALGYLVQHPLGIGLDQFYAYHLPNSGRSLIDPALIGTSEQFAAHPHNLMLDIWLRMGPFGLVAFTWLVVRIIRTTWRRTNRQAFGMGVLAACVAALTHGLVDHFYFVPDLAIVFWLLVASSELPDQPIGSML
jgi:putative inorganic carbon (hco3(-)) transporter